MFSSCASVSVCLAAVGEKRVSEVEKFTHVLYLCVPRNKESSPLCLAHPKSVEAPWPEVMVSALSLSKPPSMSSSPNPWLLIHILLFLPLTHPLSAAHVNPINGTCHDKCGTLPVRFPFGTGSGCGHPDFARYIRCSSGTLQFSTGTGVYTVSSIDYPTNTLIVTDPLMSNCSSMQNSGSFNLDRASPFSIVAEDIFVLLGCSTTSPVFDQNEELCDTGSGLNFCRGLYSCKGVAGIGLAPNAPISTCCVYEPQIVLGSGFMLDLPKLQCASYASIYGYGGDEGDPMKWEFGISLQYNGSHENEACKNCEDSGGLCGFAGLAESFACICRNGVNTTNNCYGRGYAWSGTCRHKIQTKMSVGGFRRRT